MVQVSYPGVYIQEVPSGVRTITGVSTSITAFIGVAASGPMFVPTTVLNFTDYTRAFSGDTSAGEMTDQVRQFFLNGGSQAVIVRIANAPQVSNTILNKADGSPALTLLARSQGKSGDALRARVDYNTPSPERTFNLTVYTESFDSAGNATAGATETFPNVSVDPSDPRFVKTILEANSALVGTVTVNGGTAIAPYSMSGLIFPANTDVSEKVIADIAAATTSPTATDGKFVVRVGANTHVVTIPKTPVGADAAARLTWLLASINEDLGGEATATIPAVSPGHFALVITANSPTGPGDVVIERAPDSDIALGSRLGTAQGGVEFGRMATHRPAPNGFVSVASSLPAEINAATLMDTLDIVTTEFGTDSSSTGRSRSW
jgi:uncharacterized protein